MLQAPVDSASEAQRLLTLRDLVVLDSEPEEVFDSIARLASQVCGAPIALLSLVDEERQWFKANVGLPGVNETPRDVAFCDHAIRSPELFKVPDATQDARFAENPLVTGAPDIRFYAGAPLALSSGARVGTLCVIDRRPRDLSEAQIATLQSLAAIATQALELRRNLINKTLAIRSEYEKALSASEARHRALVEQQSELVGLCHPNGELVYANPAYARHFGHTPAEMVGLNLLDRVDPNDREQVKARLLAAMQTGQECSGENRLLSADGRTLWMSWATHVQRGTDGQALLHSVGRDVTARKVAEEALRASQQFLLRTGQVAGVGGWELDLRTSEVTWSDHTREIHEVDSAFVPTLQNALQFYTPQARTAVEHAVELAMKTGQGWDLELPFITAKGRSIWVRTVGEIEFERDQAVRAVGALQDVTHRKDLERRLARETATLSAVIEAIPANVSIIDRDGVLRFVNSAFERWIGQGRGHLVGKTHAEVLGQQDYQRSLPWIQRALAGETVTFEKEFSGRTGSSHMAMTYVPLWDEHGSSDGFVKIALDISQHRAEQDRLVQLSQRDPLTGLLNRLGFESYMDRQVAAGTGATLAMLCIDLDRFKPVNDLHGHAAGDKLLQQFAQRLRALVRPTDAVARLGGDEFAVVLAGITAPQHADAVAEKIVTAAAQPFEIGALVLTIGASVGVAWSLAPGDPWSMLLDAADGMLYKAKGAGRGRRATR